METGKTLEEEEEAIEATVATATIPILTCCLRTVTSNKTRVVPPTTAALHSIEDKQTATGFTSVATMEVGSSKADQEVAETVEEVETTAEDSATTTTMAASTTTTSRTTTFDWNGNHGTLQNDDEHCDGNQL